MGQVLNCLEACRETVSCDGEEFTGPEYRSHLINKICSVRYRHLISQIFPVQKCQYGSIYFNLMQTINNIKCNFRWPQNNILHIGQMFQDITISHSEMAFFIEKICSSLSLVKFDVVPQIVHLLLLSAAKVTFK